MRCSSIPDPSLPNPRTSWPIRSCRGRTSSRSCGNGSWMHAAYRPPRARGSVAARRACSDASKTPSLLFESKGEHAMQQERQLPCRSYQEGCRMTRHSVHIKVDGRTYAGAYSVDRKVLTVTTSFGKKSAPVGHQVSHEILAHQLLHELVQEEKGRKGSRL